MARAATVTDDGRNDGLVVGTDVPPEGVVTITAADTTVVPDGRAPIAVDVAGGPVAGDDSDVVLSRV